jgi:hypothetical protein
VLLVVVGGEGSEAGMTPLRCLVLLLSIALLGVGGCGGKEEPAARVEIEEAPPVVGEVAPDWGLVANGGFDTSDDWATASVRFVDGRAIFEKKEAFQIARAIQSIEGLEPDCKYVLSLRLSADSVPDAEVIAGVVGPGYESARRRLVVHPDEITTEPKTFEKIMFSETPPDSVALRIFTRSTKPVVVDNVSLVKLE